MSDWQDSLYELPPLPDTLAGDELPPQYSPPATPAAAAPPVPEYGPGFGVPLPFDEWGLEEQASPAEQPVAVPVDPATDPPSMGRTGALAPGYELADTELTKPELPGALVSEGVVEGMPFAYDLDQPVEAPTPDYELGVDTDAARMYQEDAARNAADGAPIDPYAASPYEGLNPEEMTTTGLAMANQMAAAERERRQAEQLAELAVEQQREAERRIEEERIARAREDLAIEELNREAEELSEQGVDTGRWWNSRSTGQKVAGFASAFLAGFMQPLQGGPNQILDLMDREIDRDIAAQKADMHNSLAAFDRKRGLVREYYDRLKSSQVAEYQARQVYWQGVVNRINQEAAQFDANGFARRNAELLKRGAEAKAAESRAQAEAALREEGRKERELRMKEAKTQAEIAKMGGAGRGGGVWRDANQKAAALKRWGVDPKDSGKYYFVSGYDEPPLEFATAGAQEEFVKKRNDTESAVRIIDQILAAQEKYGWEHPIWNSNQGRKMRAQYTSLMMKMKNAWQLGALSGDDIELVNNGLGGDPTALRDTAASLRAQRQILEDDTRIDLKNRKYVGARAFAFPQLYSPSDISYVSDEELAGSISTRSRPGMPDAPVGARTESVEALEERYQDEPAKGAQVLADEISAIEADSAALRKDLRKAKKGGKAAIEKAIRDNDAVMKKMVTAQAKFAARAAQLKGRERSKGAAKETRVSRPTHQTGAVGAAAAVDEIRKAGE